MPPNVTSLDETHTKILGCHLLGQVSKVCIKYIKCTAVSYDDASQTSDFVMIVTRRLDDCISMIVD